MTSPQQLPAILRAAAQRSEVGGIHCGAGCWSYRQIDESSDRLASYLAQLGVQNGDRVVAVLPNSIEFVVTCFAVWKLGAVFVPLDRRIKSAGLSRVLRDCLPTVLVVDAEGLHQFERGERGLSSLRVILTVGSGAERRVGRCPVEYFDRAIIQGGLPTWHEAEPTEPVSIHYTSGSTGGAKGVVHSHNSWLAGITFTRDYHQLSASDAMIVPFPLHHAYAFRQLLTHVLAGATLILATDIYDALRLLNTYKPTAILLVPSACGILLDHFRPAIKHAGSFLRYIEVGSASLAPHRFDQLLDLLPDTRLELPYGLTEARVGFLARGSEGLLNRLTHIAPGLDVRVVDDRGRRVRRGEVGQITLRGAGLMHGYYRNPIDAGGTPIDEFLTGDVGRVDERGAIELLGRIDDMINVGGKKVSPVEVEMVLSHHPALADSAVVGLPDPDGIMGDVIHAFVVPRPEASLTESEMLVYCRTHLENHKVPLHFHFRTSLAKSPLGKTLRPTLAVDQRDNLAADPNHDTQTL